MADSWRSEKNFALPSKVLRLNWIAVLVIAAIGALGVVMLYSVAGGTLEGWAERQIWRLGAGLVLLLVIALVDLRVWLAASFPIYAVVLALLVAVPYFGTSAGGARRWLEFGGGIQLQPSELMKVSLVMALGAYFHYCADGKISKPLYLIVPLVLVAVPAALIVKQPDLGTAALILVVGLAVIFQAGVHWAYFVAGGIAVCSALPFLWHTLRDYQKERIYTFLDPERDPLGAGYHILQSKIAVGSGGLEGKGLMGGTQSQLNFLPEKHTDFIFTTLAEELGLIGASGLLGLYALLLAFGVYTAWRAESRFGQLVAGGVTFMFFLYIFINVAMVTGLVPVVGVPLPLVSYGGTALLTLMAGLGLVLNVALHRSMPLERGGSGGGGSIALPKWPVRK